MVDAAMERYHLAMRPDDYIAAANEGVKNASQGAAPSLFGAMQPEGDTQSDQECPHIAADSRGQYIVPVPKFKGGSRKRDAFSSDFVTPRHTRLRAQRTHIPGTQSASSSGPTDVSSGTWVPGSVDEEKVEEPLAEGEDSRDAQGSGPEDVFGHAELGLDDEE